MEEWLTQFCAQTNFPQPAQTVLVRALAQVKGRGFAGIVADYWARRDTAATQNALTALAAETGIHLYTLWLLTLVMAAKPALDRVKSPQVFWATCQDLGYKARECWALHGVWGTFVAHWYPILYAGELFKLGRMEYQVSTCRLDAPVTAAGVTVRPGETVLQLHIPSSGEPFTLEARMDSYRQAWQFFHREKLVCLCSSWLLYPPYGQALPQGSHVRDFARDFTLLRQTQTPDFADGWRVFGRDWQRPVEELPENTTMQRGLKAYFCRGGMPGIGQGMLVFDGQRLLTRN